LIESSGMNFRESGVGVDGTGKRNGGSETSGVIRFSMTGMNRITLERFFGTVI